MGIDRNPEPRQWGNGASIYDQYCHFDLANKKDLEQLFNRFPISHCIHLAGPADVPYSFRRPGDDLAAQLFPLQTLLDTIRSVRSSVKLLLVSSAAVYGNPEQLPVRESDTLSPLSPYGYHKMMQELMCAEFNQCYGVSVAIARLFSVYGPGQRKLAIWEIANRALQGDFTVFGTGQESRDYLYVDDIAPRVQRIMEQSTFNNTIYNIASGIETAMTDVVDMIYEHLEITEKPHFSRKGERGKPVRWQADVTQLNTLGQLPMVSMSHGLAKTLTWIRKNV